jgi:hypothetical protein
MKSTVTPTVKYPANALNIAVSNDGVVSRGIMK